MTTWMQSSLQADIYVCYQWRSPISPTVPEGESKNEYNHFKIQLLGYKSRYKKVQSCSSKLHKSRSLFNFLYFSNPLFIHSELLKSGRVRGARHTTEIAIGHQKIDLTRVARRCLARCRRAAAPRAQRAARLLPPHRGPEENHFWRGTLASASNRN